MADNKRLQVRVYYTDGQLHFQGIGVEVNREYGLSVDVRVPNEITNWLKMQSATLPSAAGSGPIYVPTQMKEYDVDGKPVYQLFIEGSDNDKLNHPNGAMLNMQPKSDAVGQLIDFCIQSGIVETVIGEAPFVGEQDE